jgi:tetratricopeptide (TPR) repeat protein
MNELLVWNELGNLYFKLGALDEAIAVYEKAIEEAPNFGWPYSNLGLVYSRQGNYAQAIPLYCRSIELMKKDKDKAISWNRLGDAYRRLNDPRSAMVAYQKAVELDVGELEKAVDRAFKPKDDCEAAEDEPGASAGDRLADLKAVEAAGPVTNSSQAVAPSGAMADWLRQLEADKVTTTGLSGAEDKDLQEWLQSSAVGTPVAAEHYWVLDTNRPGGPQSPTVALTKWVPAETRRIPLPLKAASQGSGSPQTAVDELDPPAPFTMLVNGSTVQEAAATETIAEAAEREKKKKKPVGKLEETAEAYAKIAKNSPANDRVWDALGNSLRALGRYEEALAAFEQALSIFPGKEEYHYHRGLVFAAQKRHEEAVAAFQEVIRLNPEYILAHGALAGSYRRMGRDAEANEHIRIARPSMEGEKEYNRACFEAICGNPDQAIEYLRVALVTKQTPLEWIRSDPDLESLHDDPRFQELLGQEKKD